MDTIYLDNSAATPIDKRVHKAMEPYFSENFGNPGSIHVYGQEAQKALDISREKIARALGVEFNEILFTGSATEANNLFIRGIFEKCEIENPKAIISSIEHESISETVKKLEKRGFEVIEIPVSKKGVINLDKFKEALDPSVCLVSIIYASNDIGSIQPIAEMAKIVSRFKKEAGSKYPIFHTDAVQALQFLEINVDKLGVDSLTLSGQKIYGPKGVGVLYLEERHLSDLEPQLTGGIHEFGIRAGTPNVPAIVGMGEAVEVILKEKDSSRDKIKKLRDMLWDGLKEKCPEIEINGDFDERLPNNLNIYFPGQVGQDLLLKLDMTGIAASTGSACSVKASKKSKTILALGYSDERAGSSIRFTLGKNNTEKEIKEATKRIVSVL